MLLSKASRCFGFRDFYFPLLPKHEAATVEIKPSAQWFDTRPLLQMYTANLPSTGSVADGIFCFCDLLCFLIGRCISLFVITFSYLLLCFLICHLCRNNAFSSLPMCFPICHDFLFAFVRFRATILYTSSTYTL